MPDTRNVIVYYPVSGHGHLAGERYSVKDEVTAAAVHPYATVVGYESEWPQKLNEAAADYLNAKLEAIEAVQGGDGKFTAAALGPASVTRLALGADVAAAVNAVGNKALLRTYHAALANVDAAAVDILGLGDSTVEGGNATDRNKVWLARLRDSLRKWYQPAGIIGGEGYVPVNYVHSTITEFFTRTGGGSTWGAFGLGGNRNFKLGSSATLLTGTFVGTSVKVFYGKGSGVGMMGVKIDGGSVVNINGNQGTTADGFAQSFGPYTAGSHTIELSPVSGDSAPEGIMIYNGDEAAGIRMWNGGHSGYTSGQMLLGPEWFSTIALIQPKLVLISLGLNDYSGNIDPSTFKANMVNIISRVRAQCTVKPSIVLIVPLGRLDTVGQYPWQQYVDATFAIAAEDGDIAVLDLPSKIGTTAVAKTTGVIDSDSVHMTPVVGGGWYANAVAEFIRP